MPLDYDKLLALQIPDVLHDVSERDAILYALGVGIGQDPVDEAQLAFVTEQNLKALPTFACVLGYTPFWLREAGIDFVRAVHGEQGVVIHRPLPTRGRVIGVTRVLGAVDKGPGKGALIYSERRIVDADDGEPIATLTQTTFCRGDGGFGGPQRTTPAPHALPERAPDFICDLATRPEAALIYRLSGDTNPLHSDPAHARAAGFPRPILHGLATFGVAGHAILKTICGYDPSRLTAMSGRFSAPVYPGETIRTEMWRDGEVVSFRARVVERDVTAINNGRVEIRVSP
jgi:acyl dehydratase